MVNKLKEDLLKYIYIFHFSISCNFIKKLYRTGLDETFEKAVEKAIENQTVHWKNKIKEHVGATVKSQKSNHPKDMASEYNRSLYFNFNDDRGYSQRKRWNY